MSLFVTKIPVDLAKITASLPPDSDLEGVAWNGVEVEVSWSNRHLLTGLTCAVEWPQSDLAGGKRPAIVKDRELKIAPPNVPTQAPKPVGKRAPRAVKERAK